MNNIQTAITIIGINAHLGYPQFEFKTIRVAKLDTRADDLIKGRKYVPKAKDKIYIYSGCDIPRFKVKQFCDKYNVSRVKFEDRATVKLIGPGVIDKLTEYRGSYTAPKDYFLSYLTKILGTEDPRYAGLFKAIEDSEYPRVMFDNYQVEKELDNKEYFQMKLYRDDDARIKHNQYDPCTRFVNEEAYQRFLGLVASPIVYHQDDLLTVLNTGTILDEDKYDSIKKLFESTDVENTKIGMEALANCDYQRSAVPILLLLKEYGSKMHDSGNRNHVNFKSLLKYFNIHNLSYLTLDCIINALRHQKLLNPENLTMLLPLATAQINKENDLGAFQIEEIGLCDKLKPEVSETLLEDGNRVEIIEDDIEEINPHFE